MAEAGPSSRELGPTPFAGRQLPPVSTPEMHEYSTVSTVQYSSCWNVQVTSYSEAGGVVQEAAEAHREASLQVDAVL